MKNLVIVESGAKATKITEYLNKNFPEEQWEVSACLGHIRDLPDDENAVNPENWEDLSWEETQKGKKFGVLHMEDYHGAFKFFLFGDDYIKFKSFLTPTWLIHISGRVKKKFYNDDLEFKINNISLLSELTDSEVRDVVLKLELNSLTETLVDQTVKLVEKNMGKHSLVISVVDSENNYKVDLLSRKLKVDINNDFVSEINSIQEVSLSVD